MGGRGGQGRRPAAASGQESRPIRRPLPRHEPGQGGSGRRPVPARPAVHAVSFAPGRTALHRRTGPHCRHPVSAAGKVFLDPALPGDLDALSGSSRRAAQLRLVGFVARATRGPSHAPPLAPRSAPLVEEGTWAWLEIADSDLFTAPLPANVVASAFANRGLYLVLANYGRQAVEIRTADAYRPAADRQAQPQQIWRVEGRSLCLLAMARPAMQLDGACRWADSAHKAFPKPPPPGVSMVRQSPGCTGKYAVPGRSSVDLSGRCRMLRPRAPGSPPSRP